VTRKDFEAIAAALNASRTCWAEHPAEDYPETPDPRDPAGSICPEQAQWTRTVRKVGDALAASNGRFDRGRFEAACNR
jgi:hypothetical protein